MDDLLEHIEEDVDLPDDDDEEEEEELNGGSSEEPEPDKKAKLDPDAICTTKSSNQANGIAAKLPTLPPLPPPLLNLEFLKVPSNILIGIFIFIFI